MSDGTMIATSSQTVGPFFHIGLHAEAGARAARESLRLLLCVTDGDGRPVDDALLELWQPEAFVRCATATDGTCEVETVRPGGPAAHINMFVFARGLLRHLQTRVYFEGDTGLDRDPVLLLIPKERRNTLLARQDAAAGRWMFEVRLQGADETVFFHV